MNDKKRMTMLARQERILGILKREAGKGNFYVPTSFSEVFEGYELGCSSNIQRYLRAMVQEGRITLALVVGIKKPFMLPMELPHALRSVVQRQEPLS